jgi:hypothetical protein
MPLWFFQRIPSSITLSFLSSITFTPLSHSLPCSLKQQTTLYLYLSVCRVQNPYSPLLKIHIESYNIYMHKLLSLSLSHAHMHAHTHTHARARLSNMILHPILFLLLKRLNSCYSNKRLSQDRVNMRR